MTGPAYVVAVDERNSVPFQLVTQADRHGAKPFVRFEQTGEQISFAELAEAAEAGSSRLRGMGIARGTMAAIYLPNSVDFVVAWFTCLFGGCVDVPINPEYRKTSLLFALMASDAQVLFTDSHGLAQLVDTEVRDFCGRLDLIVLCGEESADQPEADRLGRPGLRIVPLRELIAPGACRDVWREVNAHELASIRFTSGTTGSAKGIMHSHLHMLGKAMVINRILEADSSDVLYSPFPLHHNMTSINGLIGMLQLGATIVCAKRFSASRYWPEISACGATLSHILSPMMPMLLAQPPSPADRDHAVRFIWTAPGSREFVERFRAQPIQGYALSEIGGIAFRRDGGVEGSSARGPVAPDMEVCIVDQLDRPLPTGVRGQIAVRPRHPHRMTLGYFGDLPATLTAFRNLWYHTGDEGFIDADGELHFLGRLGDTIRRRGVNMSSEQIESEILRHPMVESCGVLGVPSPMGDDDIHMVVLPRLDARRLNRADAEALVASLIHFLGDRLPRDYVPRYVELVDDLPRTPTGKVRKSALREILGRGPTWDREARSWNEGHVKT